MMEERKRLARQAGRAARRAQDPAARHAASKSAAARALALPELAGVRAVLVYSATPEEIDPAPIAASLLASGVRIAYPRVCGPGELALHWSDGGDLEPGHCGIREPSATSPEADPHEIDAVLVPGAAFDHSCRRLGMGGGFYDRLLTRLRPDAAMIGLAFDEQVLDDIPVEEHDVALHAVVTPTRTLRPAR
jgi:5-formyltetrahydrofolate cyclo-ligase